MKLIISFLLFLTCSLAHLFTCPLAYSQTLVSSNKQWNNITHDYWNYYHWFTETFRFTDDTLIGPHTWKIVERSVDSLQLEWQDYGFIREDAAKRVYFRETASGPEYLFYDFGLQLYDTITVYGINTLSGNRYIQPMTYLVMAIDSIQLGDTLRRQIHLSIPPDTTYAWDSWIEGMGNLGGLFHNRYMYVGCDYHELLCFTEDDLLQYQNPEFPSCYVVTGLSPDAAFPDAVTLYPTPAGNQVTIDAPVGAFETYTITSLTGQIVQSGLLPESMTLNIESLPPGIYLIRLDGVQKGKRKTMKLMKK